MQLQLIRQNPTWQREADARARSTHARARSPARNIRFVEGEADALGKGLFPAGADAPMIRRWCPEGKHPG